MTCRRCAFLACSLDLNFMCFLLFFRFLMLVGFGTLCCIFFQILFDIMISLSGMLGIPLVYVIGIDGVLSFRIVFLRIVSRVCFMSELFEGCGFSVASSGISCQLRI